MVRIEGSVWVGDAPAAGAVVRMVDRAGRPLDVVCDRVGCFSIPEGVPGPYEVRVPAHEAFASFVVPEVPVFQYTLHLPEERLHRGKILDSETGLPVRGAVVTSVGSDGEILDRDRSDAVGAFVLHRARCRGSALEIEKEGYLPQWRPAEGSEAVHLRRSAALEGQVVHDDGRVVSHVDIEIEIRSDETALRSVLTNAHGRFRLDALPPGDVVVSLRAGPFSAPAREVSLRPGRVQDLLWILSAGE